MNSNVTKKSKKKKEVQAWIIPPTHNVTFLDLVKASQQIGAQVQLKYHPKRREFTAFTLSKERSALELLRKLFIEFPERKMHI